MNIESEGGVVLSRPGLRREEGQICKTAGKQGVGLQQDGPSTGRKRTEIRLCGTANLGPKECRNATNLQQKTTT